MKSVMLDLETLSTRPDAAILSFGLVEFTEQGVVNSVGMALRMDEVTGHIDPRTVAWWMNQNEAARNFSFGGEYTRTTVAATLSEWLANVDELWANDPDADVVWLRSWWDRLPSQFGRFPVSYRACRSVRTIYAEAKRLSIQYGHICGNGHVAHNPVDDAALQARAVIFIRNEIARQMLRISPDETEFRAMLGLTGVPR